MHAKAYVADHDNSLYEFIIGKVDHIHAQR